MSGTLHTGLACKSPDLNRTFGASGLVSIAGSAGAFEGLWRLLVELPPDLGAAVAVALHTGPGSRLASTLAIRSRLPVRDALPSELLMDGCVYVPKPGTHLIVNPDGRMTVSLSPRLGLYRPSADWLFESGAASFTNRHVAVVLSGMLSDGAAQLSMVKRLGGTVLVEDPSRAAYQDMPAAAIATGCADRVLGIDRMAEAICGAVARQSTAQDVGPWESPFGA